MNQQNGHSDLPQRINAAWKQWLDAIDNDPVPPAPQPAPATAAAHRQPITYRDAETLTPVRPSSDGAATSLVPSAFLDFGAGI